MSYFDMAKKYGFGLEDTSEGSEQSIFESGEDAVEAVIAQAKDVESIISEDISETECGLVECVDDVSKLEETVVTLEHYSEYLNAASGARGLTRREIIGVGIGMESVLKRFNVPVDRFVPSLESFGLEEDRVEATKSTAQKVKAFAMRIYEALAKALSFVWEKAKELTLRLRNWSPILNKRLAMASEALQKFDGEIKSEVVVGAALYKRLSAGAVTDAGKLAGTIDVTVSIMDSIVDINKFGETFSSVVNSTVASINKDNAEQVYVTSINKVVSDLRAQGNKVPTGFTVPDGYEVLYSTKALPGNKVGIVAVKKDEAGLISFDNAILGMRDLVTSEKVPDNASITGITKDVLVKMVEACKRAASNTDQIIKGRQLLLASEAKTINAIKSAIGSIKDENGKNSEDTLKLLRKVDSAARFTAKLGASNVDSTLSYILNSVAPSVLQLVSVTLKQSKSEASAAAPKEGEGN